MSETRKTHYRYPCGWWPLCGAAASKAKVADRWDDVTCKRCLRARDREEGMT